jgi:hypothetical protein
MDLIITREYFPKGTNGELFLNGTRLCFTIELPWRNNHRQTSCVPEGKYELRKRYTERFGNHLILLNVPNRDYILLHAANDALKEIKGCIASVTTITGEGLGENARLALRKVVAIVYPAFTKGEKVYLTIQKKQS